MPHVSSGGGDDLGSADEVKVFTDEGEDEKRSAENFAEEKSSLIDLTESEEKSGSTSQSYSSSNKNASRSDHSPGYGKVEPTPHTSSFNMGYLVSPYPYHNGSAGPIPVSMVSFANTGSSDRYRHGYQEHVASKMGLGPGHGPTLPFFCHNGDHLTQPPPAHMGIPPYQLDPKATGPMGEYWRGLGLGLRSPPAPPPPAVTNTAGLGISPGDWKRLGPLLAASGLARPPMYPFSASQYPYPMLSPEMTQVASWHTPSMYPISTGGGGFRSPYPSSLPITSTACLTSDLYRFSPTGLLPPPHPGLSPHSPHGHPHGHPHPHSLASHPAIVTPGPKQDLSQDHHPHHRQSSIDQKNSTNADNSKNQDQSSANNQDKKKPHIKKPLNAFMLYMKEMRAKVVAECTLKESAAINQILGRRWHALGREEQAKYYELARRERQLHMQLYPDWSSRANTTRGKKRKRKQDTTDGGNSMKKCRARYGLDQQSQWCKPCRRKKKCIRYMEAGDSVDGNQSEDNLGSCGSVGDAQTPPDDDTESLHHSISSPGGLSGLSSLTSPSMILPSPSTSLASPSVSLASPCMSLQSPLTPHVHHDSLYDCKPPMMPLPLPVMPHRNPVGTNPHDINNPLSVNQLTGQCVKQDKDSRAVIGVT